MPTVAEHLTNEHNGSQNVYRFSTPRKVQNANTKRQQTTKICCGAYCEHAATKKLWKKPHKHTL